MTAKQLAYLFAMMMVTGLPAYAVAQTSGNVADKVARIERKNIIGAVPRQRRRTVGRRDRHDRWHNQWGGHRCRW